MKKNELIEEIIKHPADSPYTKAVREIAVRLIKYDDVDDYEGMRRYQIQKRLLRGAEDWHQFVNGIGNPFIPAYNGNIAALGLPDFAWENNRANRNKGNGGGQ